MFLRYFPLPAVTRTTKAVTMIFQSSITEKMSLHPEHLQLLSHFDPHSALSDSPISFFL